MKTYTLQELKEIQHNYNSKDFFNLSSKLSKKSYKINFSEKYNEFYKYEYLSLDKMRRYYNDYLYMFYIDNNDEIKNNPSILINYIDKLDSNKKKSLTNATIKSVYPEIYEEMIAIRKPEISIYDNKEYYIDRLIKGSTFSNKEEIIKEVTALLSDDALIDLNDGCKLTYVLRKFYKNEDIKYRCSTCNAPIEAYKQENKECKECHLNNKQIRSSLDRKNRILEDTQNHIKYVSGDFFTTDFYNENFTIECSKCNKERNYVFKSKKRLLKCPFCDEGTVRITKRINEDFGNIFDMNNRKFIAPLEIDLINHDHKICIEYNGLMFHSSGTSIHAKFNKPQIDHKYHLRKTELVELNDYQLFHVFENEWLNENKRNIWKSVINNKLGLTERIYARKCAIKEISYKESSLFLEKNHLQGNCVSNTKIGLFYNNELMSVMTFRKNKTYQWEIARFANKINNTVIGGASRLLKYFEKIYQPETLVSYANRRWSQGNLYKKLGFECTGNTPANYFYFKNNECILYSREMFQKHKLKSILDNFDEKLTETENMFNNNYRKIYDCGSIRFIKIYK